MTLEQLEGLTLGELIRVGNSLGLRGMQLVKTKAKAIEKIKEECETLGVSEVPDLEAEVVAVEQTTKSVEVRKRIKDYPRKKVIIESRNPEEKDYVFSVNEYDAFIQFGRELLLPIPVIDMIKGLTEPKMIKDDDTGYSKTIEIKRFIVQYV